MKDTENDEAFRHSLRSFSIKNVIVCQHKVKMVSNYTFEEEPPGKRAGRKEGLKGGKKKVFWYFPFPCNAI